MGAKADLFKAAQQLAMHKSQSAHEHDEIDRQISDLKKDSEYTQKAIQHQQQEEQTEVAHLDKEKARVLAQVKSMHANHDKIKAAHSARLAEAKTPEDISHAKAQLEKDKLDSTADHKEVDDTLARINAAIDKVKVDSKAKIHSLHQTLNELEHKQTEIWQKVPAMHKEHLLTEQKDKSEIAAAEREVELQSATLATQNFPATTTSDMMRASLTPTAAQSSTSASLAIYTSSALAILVLGILAYRYVPPVRHAVNASLAAGKACLRIIPNVYSLFKKAHTEILREDEADNKALNGMGKLA
jgi:hypothetical protein